MLQKLVVAEEADLGIAFDGDGDRVIMVDHKGEVVDGDELLFIIAKQGFTKKRLHGGVVGTLITNLGCETALRALGIEFMRTKVGDRYVLEALQKTGWLLGGEASGHVVNFNITTTGDGIITALQVLSAMYDTGKNLHKLKQDMLKFPQATINVKVNKAVDIMQDSDVKKAIKNAEQKLGKSGRVLIRPSGTEPVIRVMVEGENEQYINSIARDLAEVVENCIK
jgi:phosphoglucosamine mutase